MQAQQMVEPTNLKPHRNGRPEKSAGFRIAVRQATK
jgi:hypothetical protein